jgi:hypothetical protein
MDNLHDVSRDVIFEFVILCGLRYGTVSAESRVDDSSLKDHASVFTAFIVFGVILNLKTSETVIH